MVLAIKRNLLLNISYLSFGCQNELVIKMN